MTNFAEFWTFSTFFKLILERNKNNPEKTINKVFSTNLQNGISNTSA
jgi:hypothetical protein